MYSFTAFWIKPFDGMCKPCLVDTNNFDSLHQQANLHKKEIVMELRSYNVAQKPMAERFFIRKYCALKTPAYFFRNNKLKLSLHTFTINII